MLLVRDYATNVNQCNQVRIICKMKKNAQQSNSRTLLPAVLCRTVISEVVKLHVCLNWFLCCRGSWVTMQSGDAGRLLVWFVGAVSVEHGASSVRALLRRNSENDAPVSRTPCRLKKPRYPFGGSREDTLFSLLPLCSRIVTSSDRTDRPHWSHGQGRGEMEQAGLRRRGGGAECG